MEFTGSVAGGVAGMLNIKGDGDEVTITPALTSGVKVATIVLNEGKPDEESFDLYAPEGVSSYADLSDKPSINGHTLSGNQSSSDLELFSGSYNDLSNKPTLNGVSISGNMYSNIYSNNETKIGTWFGEDLYCKSFEVVLNDTINYINVESLNIDKLVEIKGMISGNNGYQITFPYYETVRYYAQFNYEENTNSLYIFTGEAMPTYYTNYRFTIFYTKSTN